MATRAFYDLDTPVTLARLAGGEPVPYLRPRGPGARRVRRLTMWGIVPAAGVGTRIEPLASYYGGGTCAAHICVAVQPRPLGPRDATFQARPMIVPDERVRVGPRDTVRFPVDGSLALPDHGRSFLLFPLDRPEYFDAVVTDRDGRAVGVPAGATYDDVGTLPGCREAFHELGRRAPPAAGDASPVVTGPARPPTRAPARADALGISPGG